MNGATQPPDPQPQPQRPPQPARARWSLHRSRRLKPVTTTLKHPKLPLFGVIILAVMSVVFSGVNLDRKHVFLWVLLGLLSVSFGDLRRWTVGVVRDWIPLFVILWAYSWLRGHVGSQADTAHVLPQIQFDRWLLHGHVSTMYLQHHFFHADAPRWYDFLALGIYMSHFVASFLVAAVLWKVAYPRFVRFMRTFVMLSLAGFVTFALYPAMPPWLASAHGLLPPTTRVVHAMWQYINVHAAADLFTTNSKDANPVAAIPSLHAGFAMLILIFFWRDGWKARVPLMAYAFGMALTLMYSGEHYVLDILLGWSYALGCYLLVGWLDQRVRIEPTVRRVGRRAVTRARRSGIPVPHRRRAKTSEVVAAGVTTGATGAATTTVTSAVPVVEPAQRNPS